MHIKEFSKFTTGRVKVTPSESLKFSFGKARLGGGGEEGGERSWTELLHVYIGTIPKSLVSKQRGYVLV